MDAGELLLLSFFFLLNAVVINASDKNGFFCRVGPLMIFVSKHAMPEDIIFQDDCFVSQGIF